jgi:hypothetical protein
MRMLFVSISILLLQKLRSCFQLEFWLRPVGLHGTHTHTPDINLAIPLICMTLEFELLSHPISKVSPISLGLFFL